MVRVNRMNQAPPLFLILLWHHFCYYKRHPILLAFSLLMPFLLILGLYGMVYGLTNTFKLCPQQFLPCVHQTTPSISAGPLHYSGLYDFRNQHRGGSFEYGCTNGSTPKLPSGQCTYENLYQEESLSLLQPYSTGQGSVSGIGVCDGSYHESTGFIFYYPNSSSIAQRIMANVEGKLRGFNDARKRIVDIRGSLRQEHTILPGTNLVEMADNTKCLEGMEKHVKGFQNRREMFEEIEPMINNTNYQYRSPFWAILNFEGNDDESKSFRYTMMKDSINQGAFWDSSGNIEQKRIDFVQDLVESAMVNWKLNSDQLPMAPLWKILPSKCWLRPQDTIFSILLFLIPLACIDGFLFAPVNFVEQVVTEKKLKLREYLSIMGVNDIILKLSWIIFYLIFLIPASVIVAILIHVLLSDFVARSSLLLIIFIFVLFNVTQLLFSYFLSSFMKEPRRVGLLLFFINLVPAIAAQCAFALAGYQLTGSMAVAIRLISVHCAVPFVLSLDYVLNWEVAWVGGQWPYFLSSPVITDQYGGFGEAILWMMADCILYLILAWYLQNVMPGEYGVKRPLYFFLQPSYWMPKKFGDFVNVDEIDMNELSPDIEPRENGNSGEAVLIIDRLTKFYNRYKFGVDRLSLLVYRNEITSLLGQNGAGKSTTMNTLVGLLSPTAGRFSVAGFDNVNQMNKIKTLLGFVPQYDILYPSMNVEEHLQFFGWLKGFSKTEIHTLMYPLLDTFGMSHLKRTATTALSGGQKRKLSVLTAFLGDPELVILDEPTSGVDAYSRRSIWDVLLHHRSKAAIIVSTHFMDEADLLSDRVAIISEGTLRCVGSPMYLKRKYCRGFRVVTACTDEESAKKTTNFITSQEPTVRITQRSGHDLTFTVPKEYARSPRMISLIRSIEDNQQKIGVTSFGLSEPTLEEAFFAATDFDITLEGKRRDNDCSPDENDHADHTEAPNGEIEYRKVSGFGLWLYQFIALLAKRAILTIRMPTAILLQTLLPLTFVIIMFFIGGSNDRARLTPIQIYDRYRSNVMFIQDKSNESKPGPLFQTFLEHGLGPRCPNGFYGFKCGKTQSAASSQLDNFTLPRSRDACDNCEEYCQQGNSTGIPHSTTPSSELVYQLPLTVNARDWVLLANQSDHWITGGFMLFSRPNISQSPQQDIQELAEYLYNVTPPFYVVAWTREEKKSAMLNALHNLLLWTYSNNTEQTIQAYYEYVPFPRTNNNDFQKAAQRIQNAIVGTFLFILAFVFATFGVSVYVQMEKTANLKMLQLVSGVKPIVYWLANFTWDFFQYMLTLAILFIPLAIFDNALRDDLPYFFTVLLAYGLSVIPFIYTLTFIFKSAGGVNKLILGLGFISLTLFWIGISFTNDDEPDPLPWSNTMAYFLQIIPYCFLSHCLFLITMLHEIKAMAGPSAMGGGSINVYEMRYVGKRMVQAYVMAGVWTALVILMEYIRNGLFSCGRKNSIGIRHDREEDPDVAEEERRVLQGEYMQEPVIVKQVTQKYPKSSQPAVNCVTFGVPQGQCFGLLGVNGAGKTTLFRIMTAFQAPTRGQVFIQNRNVVREKIKLANEFSYCPQDNTLFDHLSVKEHLQLFAAFRGIPWGQGRRLAELLISQVDLGKHAEKKAVELSGGNKRKLNLALALLDYKPVIFLDEPTSGMDPGARRCAWKCIENAVALGSSVVLTSHNMDECEALCHRLVIMAAGRICCIGSVQYLKGKFGNVYTIKIKLTAWNGDRADRVRVIDQLKQHVSTRLVGSWLTEEHDTLLQYEVMATDTLRLSDMFGRLLECRSVFPQLVQDFTLSQVTLERVFVDVAQRQAQQSQQQQPAQA